MARLKDRYTFVPNGWTFIQPQISDENIIPNPLSTSFTEAVNKIIEVRNANPFITQQNNLSTDPEAVANELDAYTAERCLRAGWNHFLGDASPGGQWLPRRLSRSGAGVVEKAKKTVAGVKIISEWLGEGLRPVEQALADKRAARCVECPQNSDPNFIQKFETMAAEKIKQLAEIKNNMELKTPYDAQLHMCQICSCPMGTKVWVPIKHINNETSTDILNQLSAVKTSSGQGCWVPEEIAALK